MRQLVQDHATGEIRVEDVATPALRAGGVLVANDASLVSPGTERQTLDFAKANLLQKAARRPDLAQRVLDKARTDGVAAAWSAARNRLEEWVAPGYASVGTIAAVGPGVEGLRAGDRVACAGQGYASHAASVFVPQNFIAPVPPGVADEEAAFATLGAIALHGVHRANVAPGDRVAVIGLGVLGQLTVRLLAAYGSVVVGLDVRKEAVSAALGSGAAAGAVVGDEDAEACVLAVTDQIGADAVIITASDPSSDALALAAQIARRSARICVVGLVGMDADRRVFYEKELDLVVAKSYGPGRDDAEYPAGSEYPIHLSRWSVARNMREYLRLVATGRVRAADLIAERVPIEEAPAAYARLLEGGLTGGTFLIRYSPESRRDARPAAPSRAPPGPSAPRMALVGAGAFARSTLVPALEEAAPGSIVGVCSLGGIHAEQVRRKLGASWSATDAWATIVREDVNAAVVATRHDLHAPLASAALRAGKHVFVEKPLAIDRASLAEAAKEARGSSRTLMVGFNRRHAPMIQAMRQHFAGRQAPLALVYRVNAGALPLDHWIRDEKEGGGRIRSEVCHFVDTAQAIVGARVVRVFATGDARAPEGDHVTAVLEHADGSRSTILYTADGPGSVPKERIEVIGAGRWAELDNFRSLHLRDGRRSRRMRAFRQDKGHRDEMRAFARAVATGQKDAQLLEESLSASLATLCIVESISRGEPIEVREG